MRLEATVPDSRGAAVDELASQLGLSRSQFVDEALALFIKAILEVRRGRRLMTMTPDRSEPACELATPALTAIEWSQRSEDIKVSPAALANMQALMEAPAVPGTRLKAAAKRQRR